MSYERDFAAASKGIPKGAGDRGYHHGDLRNGLLQAARAILEEESLSALTLRAVALAIGADIHGGRVRVEGDLDFRGTLGVSKDAPVGFREISLRFELDTQADDEVLATLLRLTERYCVVLQTLRGGVPVTAETVARR